MELRARLGYLLAAGVGAGLANVAAPPFDCWPAAMLCWVPLLAVAHAGSLRFATACGLVQGTLIHLAGFRWLIPALHDALDISWTTSALCLLTFAILQGGRTALVVYLAVRARRRGWPLGAMFALALVSAELVYPMFVPWYSAIFVHGATSLVQAAELGGPLAISAWLAAANVGVWRTLHAWCRGKTARGARALGATAMGVAVIASFGALRMREVRADLERGVVARVGVVQGAVSTDDHRDPLDVHREPSLELVRATPNLDLVIWPETAISTPISAKPSVLQSFFRSAVLRDSRLTEHAPSIPVPLLTGAVLEAEASGGAKELLNAAVLVEPTGRVRGIYAKRELAPIGEATPFGEWVPGLDGLLPPKTAFSRGRSARALELGEHRIGISICYEDVLYRSVLETTEQSHPDLLVNLTSDTWFGDSPAAELHLALASLRAVEHRRELVRVTNDGVTAVVEPTGEVTQRLPRREAGAGVFFVRWLSGSTPFDTVGDAPWWIAFVLMLGCSFVKAPKWERRYRRFRW